MHVGEVQQALSSALRVKPGKADSGFEQILSKTAQRQNAPPRRQHMPIRRTFGAEKLKNAPETQTAPDNSECVSCGEVISNKVPLQSKPKQASSASEGQPEEVATESTEKVAKTTVQDVFWMPLISEGFEAVAADEQAVHIPWDGTVNDEGAEQMQLDILVHTGLDASVEAVLRDGEEKALPKDEDIRPAPELFAEGNDVLLAGAFPAGDAEPASDKGAYLQSDLKMNQGLRTDISAQGSARENTQMDLLPEQRTGQTGDAQRAAQELKTLFKLPEEGGRLAKVPYDGVEAKSSSAHLLKEQPTSIHQALMNQGSGGILQSQGPQEILGTAAAAKGFDQMVMSQISKAIMEKPQVAVGATGSEILVKLEPEQLGKVEIKLNLHKGLVMAEITVENQAVKAAVEANIGDLRQSLSNKGYPVEQLDVSVGDDRGHQKQFEGSFGRESKRGSGRSGSMRVDAVDEEDIQQKRSYSEFSEDEQILDYYA